ncbi:MAG: pyruvate kinase [Deltaproteobacteria bacterium]|jgi:pyruvate kinase|nr:MAG: pyruvate kinase [Deltaproteobacteria bacterium]
MEEHVLTLPKFRNTKIVCTIGPATSSPKRIRDLILAGMDVVRLNFSHGNHATHRQVLRLTREISRELGREVGILQDLGGPKIRLGNLPFQERELQVGEKIAFSPTEGKEPGLIPVNYPYIIEDVAVGDSILLADGLIFLKVLAKEADRIVCEVIVGGVIQSHKGMNLPSSSLRVPTFTEKDREDLTLGLEEEVDFVALSFVRHESDLEPVREMLNKDGRPPLLIAKIEKPQAIERLEKILAKVDGVMVARGDLGVEMPLEEVPIIQKRIVRMARQAAKPSIVATQMLRSMINSPRPTRAEAADAANAVLDGTDALMLSDETAMGAYPVEAVKILDRIARVAEHHLHAGSFINEPASYALSATASAIGRSACYMAEELKASAIVAGTTSGSTARLIARFRPACPVLGLTPDQRIARQLTLSWGVIPALVARFTETDEVFKLARLWALEHRIVQAGNRLVITAGVPVGKTGTTNLLKVIEIE